MEYKLEPSPRLRTSKSVFSAGVEREWTPTVTFAVPGDLNVVYSKRVGHSVLFGSMVTCFFNIVTTTFTHTTALGVMQISGVPHRGRSTGVEGVGTNVFTVGNLTWRGITAAGYTSIMPEIVLDNDYFILKLSGSAQAPTSVTVSEAPTGGTINLVGAVTYITKLA